MNAILLPHSCSSLSNKVLLKFILYGDEWLTIGTNNEKPLEVYFVFKISLPSLVIFICIFVKRHCVHISRSLRGEEGGLSWKSDLL